MPKRISKKLSDSNQIAAAVVDVATKDESPAIDRDAISRVMAAMGRKGGKIGGKRSLVTMSDSERAKRAKKAAQARWKQKR